MSHSVQVIPGIGVLFSTIILLIIWAIPIFVLWKFYDRIRSIDRSLKDINSKIDRNNQDYMD